MGKSVRVAVVGVGNCASSLVQGVYAYKNNRIDSTGLMNVDVCGYRPEDIEFVAAFDVAENKVGVDLSQAILAEPNNTVEFASVSSTGVVVSRGMTLDGIGPYTKDVVKKSKAVSVDVTKVLKESGAEVVVNYLPVGSDSATKWYAEHAIAAGCAFVNCIPVFIASDKTGCWPKRFTDAGLPVIGDDIKSQIGATIIHRVLTKLCEDRGVVIDRTYQLNVGGNSDFMNMLDRSRLHSKKLSKTGSVQSQMEKPLSSDNIHIGPSDYVPWLKDRKWAYIRIEGRNFGGAPISMELKLEVWDSPNSAGVVIDAIRCAKVALDRKQSGPILEPSSYFMKTPPVQCSDEDARALLERWMVE